MIEYQQVRQLDKEYIRKKVKEYIAEDMPNGDVTTESISKKDTMIKAYIQAEEDIVLSGLVTAPYFFEDCQCECFYNDGTSVQNGDIISIIQGDASSILRKERVFLNLIQRMSGIATMTRKFTEIASPFNVKILDTRKTTPGLRLFEKYSVCMGGGFNHRLDLSSGILIKDNHIRAAGTITEAVRRIKEKKHGLQIELEVENEIQIEEGLANGVDGFLLDNMNREQTITAVKKIRAYPFAKKTFIESSGGITMNNLRDYLDTGIDGISIGALTHSIKSANIHMEFE